MIDSIFALWKDMYCRMFYSVIYPVEFNSILEKLVYSKYIACPDTFPNSYRAKVVTILSMHLRQRQRIPYGSYSKHNGCCTATPQPPLNQELSGAG